MSHRSGISSRGYNPRISQMWRTHDLLERIREENIKVNTKVTERNWYWLMREVLDMDTLQSADPEGWEAWFDDDKNIPAKGTRTERCFLIESHIRNIHPGWKIPIGKFHNGVVIWEDQQGVCILTDKRIIVEFENKDSARKYVDSLPDSCIGYGYVLEKKS